MQTESPENYNQAMIAEQIHKMKSEMAYDWVKNQNSETISALRRNAFSKPLKRMTFDSDHKYDGELSTTAGSEDTFSDSGFDTPTTSPNSKVKSFDLSPIEEPKQNSRPEFLFEHTLSFIENIKAKASISEEQVQAVEEEHQGVLTYFIANQKLFKLVPRETLLAVIVVILASKIALPGDHIRNFFQNCEHLSRFNRLSEIKSEKAYRMLSRLKEKVSFSPNF
jgi:hypothetical protein